MKMLLPPKRFRTLSRAAILALLGLPLHAATVTWDNSNGTNAWSTPANWDTNLEPTSADDVIFAAGLGATLTLSTGENAKTLQFDDSYTLTGGGLTLASASTIGVLLGKAAIINTALTITGGTTKTGDGTLTLGGANTFTGGILVSTGTLRVANASAIGAAGNVATVNAGAVLEVTNGITFDRAITLNHGGTLAGSGSATSNGTITINAAATSVNLATTALADIFTIGNAANDLTGGTAATTINVNGPGTVRLASGSDFDGSWNIASGARLEVGAAGALGDTASSGVTLAGGTLSARISAGTILTGQTNLTLTASSTLLSDRTSGGAGVTHTWGTLAMGTHTLTVAPGALATSGTAGITVGNVTLSGDPTFAVNDSGATNGKLNTGSLVGGGVARTIKKTGGGDLAISGGATDLVAGSQFTMSGGGSLDLLFPTLGAGASIAVTAAQHPLGAATFSLTGGTLNLLADGDGTTGAQTFVLANGLTLAGNTIVDPARRGGSNTTKTFEIPTLTLGSGAAVGIGGANTYGLRVAGAVTLQGNATLQGTSLGTRTGALTLNGAIGDGGNDYSLAISGGTSPLNLTMNATSTYSGGTNISGSNVTLNAASALGSGPLAQTGGTLIVNVDNAIGSTITLSGTGTLRVNDNNAIQGNTVALNGGTLDLRSNATTTFTTGTLTLGGNATINVANNGSGTSQTITLGNTLNVSGNQTLTLTNANSFIPNLASIALAGDLTLNSAIAVSVQAISQDATPRRFLKAGAGTTTLLGTGTFTGGAEVLGGILLISDLTALGSSVLTVGDTAGTATATARLGVGPSLANNIVVRTGSSGAATLSTTTGGLTWAGDVSLQRTATLEGTTGATTFSGLISGVGNVIKTGGGEIILENAANSFGSGVATSVNITAGTLTVSSDGPLGAVANGVTIAGGTTFRANGTFSTARTLTPGAAAANVEVTAGNTLTLTSALGANVAFDKEGPGTLAFGPAVVSARTAATTINGGTLQLSGATGLGAASPITIAAATLDLRSDANTNFGHPLTVSSATSTVNVDRAVGGSATGGTHTLGTVALATQTLTITGSNGFGLALGTVSATGTSTLNHDAPGALTVASFGLGGTGGPFTFTQDGDGGDVFITGTLAETGTPTYNFTKRGSHTLHLGTGLTVRGTVTVADGTLDLNNLNIALTSAFTIGGGALNTAASVVAGSGSLTLGGNLTYASNGALLPASITGPLNLGAATRTFTINDSVGAPVDLEIPGPISGPAGIGFTKTGAGTLLLSGAANTFTGPLSIQQGTLSIATINNASTDGVLGNSASAVSLGNTGTLTGTISYTGPSASSTKPFTLASGGTGAFDVTTAGTNLTLTAVISGAGGLTKTGPGTLTLEGANTFGGALSIQRGTLSIATINNASTDGVLGNSATSVSLGSAGGVTGTLYYTGLTASSTRPFTLTTGGTGVFDVTAADTDLTLPGVISGSGSLAKIGFGALTLGGANTYSGATTLSTGTLRIANSSGLGATTGATVNGGTILEVMNGVTVDRPIALLHGSTFVGSGTATSNGTITIDAAATTVNLETTAPADVFTVGNGANDLTGGTAATTINVSGPGAVRLGAASNFDGSWNIASGARLELGAAGVLGDTATSGVTLLGGTLSARVSTATIFTGQTNLTLTASSTLLSDRSTAGAGVTHTLGTVAMGAHTLTVAPGANSTSGTAGITVGNVTLSGDPTFAVNDAGLANGKLTTGLLLGGGVGRTITKTGDGDLAITGGATDLVAGSQFTMSGGGSLDLLFPTLGAGALIAITAAQHPLGESTFSMNGGTLALLADGDGTTAAQTFVLANGFTLAGDIIVDPARRGGSNTTKTFEIPTLTLGSGATLGIGGANTYGLRVPGAVTLQGNATLQGTSLATRTGALTLNGAIGDGGSGYALGIAGGTSPLNLTLNATSTYSGGTNMSGSNVTLNAANALGTGPLVQTGGTLIVNVDGAHGGAITLSGTGTLRVNDNTALQGNTVALNGGTLDLRSNTATTFVTGTLTLGGDATINVGNNGSGSSQTITLGSTLNVAGNRVLTLTNANSFIPNLASIALAGDLTLNSAISVSVQSISEDGAPRRFLKTGTGTTTLTGAGSFTGSAEVLAGLLLINDPAALGSSVLTIGDTSGTATATARLAAGPSLANDIVVRTGSSGAATLSTTTGGLTWSGDVSLERSVTLEGTSGATSFSGIIGGGGNITKTGSGEIILENAANSFGSGGAASVNITTGTLTVLNDGALGTAGNGVTIAAGTTFRANGTFTSARTITPGGASANLDVTAGNTLTLTSALAGNVAFDKEGLGTLAFGPLVTSARTAVTTLNDGTLLLGGATSLGVASPITIAGATLDLRNDADTDYAHPLTIAAGTNIVNVDRAVGGVATGGTHTLGTVALANQTLNTTGSNGFGLALGVVTTTGSSTLNHDAPGALTVASVGLGGAAGTFTFTQDGDGGDVFITGTLAETGTPVYNFAKRGSHTLHLGTGLTVRGTVTVADGTLDLNNLSVALNSTLTIGGGALDTAATIIAGPDSLTLGGNLNYASNGALLPASITGHLDLGAATRTFAINDSFSAPVDLDIAGPISGPAGVGITKTGSGTLRLSGASNTFTGLTNVQVGTLELNKSAGDAIGTGGLTISATVRLLASDQIHNAAVVTLSGANDTILDLNGFTETLGSVTLVQTDPFDFTGIKTGAAGTLVLGGDLTLSNNADSASADERNILITGTGTDFSPMNDGTLDLGGVLRTINVTTSVVGANEPRANATIETAIVNGGLQKTGVRTLFLRNPANTFAGGLNIAQGTVDVSATGTAGLGPITFNNLGMDASTFRISAADVTLPNAFVVANSSTGESRIEYSGGAFTSATLNGNIQLDRNLTIDALNGTMDNGVVGTLIVNGMIDDGAGSFGLVKKGNGAVRLTGANSLSGGVIVERGTLGITADAALGAPGTPVTVRGGVLHAETTMTIARNVLFDTPGSVRVDDGSVLTLNGAVIHGANDMAFFGSGSTILSGTSDGGLGRLIVGTYAADFSGPAGSFVDIGEDHVVSVRPGFTLPAGNIWLTNQGVLELGAGDFTRPVGSGAGQVSLETSTGGGFAAFGADRVVNLGGAGATLIFGDPATKFLRAPTGFGFDGIGALILGSETATHTVTFQNSLEFNSGDASSFRQIIVPDGPAAKEAVLSGNLSLNGMPGTSDIYLEIDTFGNLDITGDITGAMTLDKYNARTLRLTGNNSFTGELYVEEGTLVANSDAALGAPGILVGFYGGGSFRAEGNIVSNRPFDFFGAPTIDTNGFNVTLASGSMVTGDDLTKAGNGTLTLAGVEDLFSLTADAGTTNVNSPLGTGFSIVNANADTNFGASQMLAELNIGPDATVTVMPTGPAPAFLQGVPEPGSLALLLLGTLAFVRRPAARGSRAHATASSMI